MARRPEAAPPARAVPQGIAAVYLPLDALRPNPRNPRAHGAEVTRLPALPHRVLAAIKALKP